VRDRDAAERAQLLRITALLGGPVLIIGTAALYFVSRKHDLPLGVVLLLFLLLLPATWGLILLVEAATERTAEQVVTSLHAGHATARAPGFSRQESLVAQGRLEEAAAAYHEHLREAPRDIAAMIALGRLLAGPLADAAGAEAAYLGARRLVPGPDWERVISNDLIDLYERTGQAGRRLVELARFAEYHRGTKAGDAAAERLRQLKDGPAQDG